MSNNVGHEEDIVSATQFHVIIIGGGLGGLCLAQGLKKAGISVAVYERDRTCIERLQGYRIHIDPQGSRALYECLPSHLYDAFAATCAKGGKGVRFSTEQLQELLFIPVRNTDSKPGLVESHKSVSRTTLRQVLLAELDEIVHFNKTFTHYQEMPDGKIAAFFEDGTSAIGDVLVAADGGNSRVRKQFLLHAQRVKTGLANIIGNVPLTDEIRDMPGFEQLYRVSTIILGPPGRAMFISTEEFDHEPAKKTDSIGGDDKAALLHPGLLFDNTSDYMFWNCLAHQKELPSNVREMDGQPLQEIAQEIITGWHPLLRRLVRESDPSTVAFIPIHTSIPIEHWETRNITLVGDAIHSMTPAQGKGCNIALRDASLLCWNLIAARRGEKSLLQAIHDYEVEMVRYGFAAVRSTTQALNMIASENRVERAEQAARIKAKWQHSV